MPDIEQSTDTKTFEVTQKKIDVLISDIENNNIENINDIFAFLNPSDAAELLSNIPEKFSCTTTHFGQLPFLQVFFFK